MKHVHKFLLLWRVDLYIPLRSDETNSEISFYIYIRIFLYIPLRSDETRNRRDDAAVATSFISHYVQMKPPNSSGQIGIFYLYIPLRSDETRRKMGTTATSGQLYIPLRSDETIINRFRFRYGYAFISHYVQMKRRPVRASTAAQTALYPTTFR